MQSLRLGAAGMRGKIAESLTPRLAMDFAAALGTYLDGQPVVVARDTRISSEMYSHAVTSALISCGCRVLDAGVAPAPLAHCMVRSLEAAGGLLISAGHHPMGWNAITPLDASGAFYTGQALQELLDVYHSRRFDDRPWDRIGERIVAPHDQRERYLDALCASLDVDAISRANFHVVADFCNGAGSVVAEAFAERLGIRLMAINKELWGILPHDPEPRPRSAMQVKSILQTLGADVGFVFNSDMSRASVVTDAAETLSEEYTVALVADHRVADGMKMVTNWCTTRTLDDVVARKGGALHRTRVGEAFIIERMQELGAELAGDGSGGAAFGGHLPAYDNFMTMGVILEAMALRACRSSELAAALPRYHIVKRSIPIASSHAYTLLRHVADLWDDAEVVEEDGFRFNWPDGWVHLRTSMTEPIIRMIVEWSTREEAEDRAMQVRGMLERLVTS